VFPTGDIRMRTDRMEGDTAARSGYTLIEVLVVLVLLGLSAALAVPALLPPRRAQSGAQRVIAQAREIAVLRGEVVYLRVEPSGEWTISAGGGTEGARLEGTLARGRMAPLASAALTLRVAPVGSCAFDMQSLTTGAAPAVDLPACDVRAR
jgi:prepilin-type N-terminal cleavage/methylation domain-containing protein